jgi:hypothetical protein
MRRKNDPHFKGRQPDTHHDGCMRQLALRIVRRSRLACRRMLQFPARPDPQLLANGASFHERGRSGSELRSHFQHYGKWYVGLVFSTAL